MLIRRRSMFCPKCGAKQDDDSRFCHSCGADLSEFLDLVNEVDEVTDEQKTQISDDEDLGDSTDNSSTKVIKPKKKEQKDKGTKDSSSSAAFVKPKKKRAVKGAAAVLVIVLIAVGALFAIKNILGKASGGDKYVFIHGETYYLSDNLSKDNEIELSSAKIDYPTETMVRFSPDDKYVYFFAKIDEDGYGSLCRAEIGKLKKDSAKNDNYIETVASNVNAYEGFRFMKNGSVIYRNADRSLYCFDGKESTKIGKDVNEYYTDKDSKLIYTVEQEEYDGEDYDYSYDLYGVDINNVDTNIKMAKDISYIINHDDFDNIYFSKYDEGEDKQSLYVAGFNKEETTKIANNVDVHRVINGDLYYMVNNGTTLKLADFVNDKGDDDIYYEFLRDEINEAEPERVSNLCVYKNGKEEVIAENVVNANIYDGMIAYNTTDMITDKISIDEIEEVYDIQRLFNIDYAKAKYVRTNKTDEIITMADNAAAKLLGSSEDDYLDFYVKGSRVYIASNNELFEASIESNQIKDVTSKGDGYVIGNDADSLYIMSNENSGYGDINVITDGESKNIAKGVQVDSLALYEDGTIFGYTDYNYDSGYGDLEMFNSNKKKKKIATDVSQYIRKKNNDIIFIADDNLYSFNGKDKSQIKNDVTQIWCSNYEKKTDTLNGRRGY